MTWRRFNPKENKAVRNTDQVNPAFEIQPGDLLISRANTVEYVGAVVLVDKTRPRLLLSDKSLRLVPVEGVDRRFLLHMLRSPEVRNQIEAKATGTKDSMRNISQETIRDLRIPLPAIAEQLRVVAAIEEALSRIDSGDLTLSRVSTRLKDMGRALVAGAIRGKVRPLSSLLAEPLRNGHSAPRTSSDDGVRTLTLTAVTSGEFSLANTKLTTADPTRVKDLWLRQGDILIERSNTPELVGTARMYRGPDAFAIFPDLLIRARVTPEHDPEYVELVLQSDGLRQYFKSRAQGISGSMPKIDQRAIETAPVTIPSLSEQREIVERYRETARALRRFDDQVNRGRRKARLLRQSLLAAACAGRLTGTLADTAP